MHGYDTYDYVARGMYPAIMSFTSVDPIESHNDPYIYYDTYYFDNLNFDI